MEADKNILPEILERIDFKHGELQELGREDREKGYILDVRWRRNVHLRLYRNKWNGIFWYTAERDGEGVSGSRMSKRADERFFHSLQHLVNEIDNGDFDFKKNISDRIAEVVCRRRLTSYMNDTKWQEFLCAMADEMSVAVPYDYKTLFEESREELCFDRCYDDESFNWYHFKSIEWVKVKPRFYERRHRGMLVEDEKIYFDVEQEFLELMKKYAISCEYDEKNGVYTIYGYR